MRFHKRLTLQATDVLDPIIAAATWTAGITAAAGTGLAQSLFTSLFTTGKSLSNMKRHSGSLCHTFVHCKKSPAAAPRKAGNSVSDSLSGLPR